jgi:hypothetical protein
MDLWGPKHVDLANVVNKINHIKYIVYRVGLHYIARWYMVHTMKSESKQIADQDSILDIFRYDASVLNSWKSCNNSEYWLDAGQMKLVRRSYNY